MVYAPLFQLGPDTTDYEFLGSEGVGRETWRGAQWLLVQQESLASLAELAFARISHLLRPSHLAQLRGILDDPDASDNDRSVARALLHNAVIAAAGELPMCQDTGTAIVIGSKGERILTEGADAAAFSAGIARTYASRNLRFSQLAPLSLYEEENTGSNLPAQIEISAAAGADYRLLFVAKGGGSANKTFLFQQTTALLRPEKMRAFLAEKIATLGAAACPPYHLAIVIGGLSAEQTLKTVKLASCRALDGLPEQGDKTGRAFRDRALEQEVLAITRELGVGAQFGGKYFCHDVQVIRLPRHAGSLPVGLGVSCSADRQAKALITAEGIFLERLEEHPEAYLPELDSTSIPPVAVDLNQPLDVLRRQLSTLPVGTRLSLSGPLVVARDKAHAVLAQRIAAGESLPAYMREHPVYYAGPAKTPSGMASGAFGPTTAARMDGYMEAFLAAGAWSISLGKGNRSPEVAEACRRHGGFYLGTIGGAAAAIARDHIRAVETLDMEELGMEAVRLIQVVDLPAFMVTDDKGQDFYQTVR